MDGFLQRRLHSDGERYRWLHYDETKAMMRAFVGESGVVVLELLLASVSRMLADASRNNSYGDK